MDKIIYLLNEEIKENEIGDIIRSMEKNKRYADINSIRQSEAYQAAAVGLKPEIMCTIWKFEYNNEPFLLYEGKEYKITRTYIKDDEKIELTCVAKVNNEVNCYGT